MVNKVLDLLNQKEGLLIRFEEISQKMSGSDIDELIEFDEQRVKLIEEMQNIDKMIKKVYENESDADKIGRAISNADDRSNVEEQYLPVFDKAQAIFARVSRLVSFQESLQIKYKELKEELLKDIKQNNKNAKVVKYLNAMDEQMVPAGSLLSNDNRKI